MARHTAQHLQRGHSAEKRAYDYLRKHGLKLLERNFRTPFGEIDLVMKHKETVIFIEVRFRRSENFGSPAETIDSRKQARLRASAEYYIQNNQHAADRPCRFDVVAISGEVNDKNLLWLKNAF